MQSPITILGGLGGQGKGGYNVDLHMLVVGIIKGTKFGIWAAKFEKHIPLVCTYTIQSPITILGDLVDMEKGE